MPSTLRWWWVFVPVVAALFAFAPAFEGPLEFVFDDSLAIENNADAHSQRGSWWALLLHDFWGKPLTHRAANRSYRPLTVATFRWQHWLNGGAFDMHALRAVNVGLHAANTVLVWLVAEHSAGLSRNAALLTSLLFGVHPIHVEAVVNIVGRAELLNALWGFMGTLALQRLLQARRWADDVRSGTRWTAVAAWYGIWVCTCVLGCLSKDSFVAVVGVQGIVAWLHPIIPLAQPQPPLPPPRQHLRAVCMLSCVAIVATYLAFRAWAMQGAVDLRDSGLLRKEENPHLFVSNPWERRVFLWYLQCKNMALMLWPWPLCAEYSFNCLPTIVDVADARLVPMVVGTLGFLVVCAVTACKVLAAQWRWHHHDRRAPLPHGAEVDAAPMAPAHASSPWAPLAVSLAWCVVPYLPVSHLFVTVGTMLAERCLYVPSLGVCMLAACLVAEDGAAHRLRQPRGARRRLLPLAVSLVVAVCIQLCWTRSAEWTTNQRLFESAVRVCPGSAKHHQQLALVRYNEGRFTEGVRLLHTALSIDPQFCEARWHIARYLVNQSRLDEAEPFLKGCCVCGSVAENCWTTYRVVRKALHPALTLAEETLDNAEALREGDPPIPATLFRQAGLAFMQQDKKPCLAYRAFRSSILVREAHGLVGALAHDPPSPEDALCNVYYWVVKSGIACRAATRNAERRAAMWNHVVAWSANATRQCHVPWDALLVLQRQPPATAAATAHLVQEMVQRPLAVKNIAMEAVMLLQESSSQTTWNDSTEALETLISIALAPLCDVARLRRWQETLTTLGSDSGLAGLDDDNAEPTFLPIVLQLTQRLVGTYVASMGEVPLMWEERVEAMLRAVGGTAQECSEALEHALRCEAAYVFLMRSTRSTTRASYRAYCADKGRCPVTAARCAQSMP